MGVCTCVTSTHTLLIERGRHLGLPPQNRLCQTCGVIEDEEHFLFHCAKYSVARSMYIENCNLSLLTKLYVNGSKTALLKVAKYVKACLSK